MDRDPIILHSTCLFFQITPRSPSASPHHFPPTGIGKELQKRNEIVAEKKKRNKIVAEDLTISIAGMITLL